MNPAMGGRSDRGVATRGPAGLSAATLAHTPDLPAKSAGGARSQSRVDRFEPQLSVPGGVRTRNVLRVDDPSPERANAQALDDLAHGAEGLAIVFEGAPNAFGHGLPASREALAAALADVPLTRTHIRLDVHPQSRASVDWLVQILGSRRVSPDKLDISFGIDPAALFAGTGKLRMSIEAMHASMPQSLAHFFALGVPGILLEADGRVFHNAGATEVQELAIMLASAISYLRMFEEARQPVLYAAAHVGFATSIDQNHHRSVAKILALRRLWARVLDSYSVPATEAVIHAETSYRMMTSRAMETNIGRGALAAFAAMQAGVSTFSALPHTVPGGLPDMKARRLSHDMLNVLAAEGNLAPIDEGSGDSEELVSFLCDSAWDELQIIEDEGGILRSISDGHVQARIAEARRVQAERLRSGLVPIVGTTIHPSAENDRKRPLAPAQAASAEDGIIFCESLPAIRLENLLDEAATN